MKKRKVQGSRYEDDVVRVDGEEEYSKVDSEEKRRAVGQGRTDRVGAPVQGTKDLGKLQDEAERSIMEDLANPLTKKAQTSGIPSNTEQHGSEL